MFVVIFVCGNLFLRIAGKVAKSHESEPAKVSCHTVIFHLMRWKLFTLEAPAHLYKYFFLRDKE